MAAVKSNLPKKGKDQTSDSVAALIITAADRFNKGDFKPATRIFSEIRNTDPNNIGYCYNMIVSNYRLNMCKNTHDFMHAILELTKNAGVDIFKLKKEHLIAYPTVMYNFMICLMHDDEECESSALKMTGMFNVACNDLASENENIDKHLQKLIKMVGLLQIYLFMKAQRFQTAIKCIQRLEPLLLTEEDDLLSKKLRIKLQQYKTACHLSTRWLTSGRAESKRLFSMAGLNSPNSHIGACLKAYYDYLKRNYKKAMKTLSTLEVACADDNEKLLINTGDNLSVIFKNNLGCCSLYMNMRNTAIVHFLKALEKSKIYSNVQDSESLPIHCSDRDKYSPRIIYNCGVTLLLMKRGKDAFPLIMYSLSRFCNNPRLWLRAAEACILLSNLPSEKLKFELESPYVDGHSKKDTPDPLKMDPRDWSKISPSLEFAQHCLNNALLCLACRPGEGIRVVPSDPIMDPNVYCNLHAAIICASTYVAFKIKNYPLAIKKGLELLSLEGASGIYSYLAKHYVGLAYLRTGDVDNALTYLLMDDKYDVMHTETQVQMDRELLKWPEISPKESSHPFLNSTNYEWSPSTEFEARALREYDLCVALIEQRDLLKAWKCLKVWVVKFNNYLPPKFVRLAVYINIKLDNKPNVLYLLQNNPRVFDDDRFISHLKCVDCNVSEGYQAVKKLRDAMRKIGLI